MSFHGAVLETRVTPEGMVRRRYKRAGRENLTTYEVPATVVRALGRRNVARWMATWKRGEAMRDRGAEIDRMLKEGIKPLAIAFEVGVTEQAVKLRRKKLAQLVKDENTQGNPC